MAENYKYYGLPITPSIIEYLILRLFNGQTLKRDIIVNGVLDYHVSNGGLYPDAQDFPRSVKKALSNLQKRNFATNRSYGFWEIYDNNSPLIENTDLLPANEPEQNISLDTIPTHNVYGDGPNAVYLYYFSNYKQLSELQNKKTWACKIGRTDRDPLIRILSQSATALPEKPVIEFIIKTNDSSLLEGMLHSALTLRGKYIKDSPGIEWFDTNPEEVIGIIKFINENILKKLLHTIE